jgi:hypothetical protein
MQWPTAGLVFPLFSTLLLLIKKRSATYPHAITTYEPRFLKAKIERF